MAEGARLESVCTVLSRTEGSNPSLSASGFLFNTNNLLSLLGAAQSAEVSGEIAPAASGRRIRDRPWQAKRAQQSSAQDTGASVQC